MAHPILVSLSIVLLFACCYQAITSSGSTNINNLFDEKYFEEGSPADLPCKRSIDINDPNALTALKDSLTKANMTLAFVRYCLLTSSLFLNKMANRPPFEWPLNYTKGKITNRKGLYFTDPSGAVLYNRSLFYQALLDYPHFPKRHSNDIIAAVALQKRLHLCSSMVMISRQLILETLTLPQKKMCQMKMAYASRKWFGCLPYWDGYTCWQSAEPGQTVVQRCPSHVEGFEVIEKATIRCFLNGTYPARGDYSGCPLPQAWFFHLVEPDMQQE